MKIISKSLPLHKMQLSENNSYINLSRTLSSREKFLSESIKLVHSHKFCSFSNMKVECAVLLKAALAFFKPPQPAEFSEGTIGT